MTTQLGAPRPVTPVTILSALLDRLALQVDKQEGIPSSLKAELATACDLARGMDPYLSRWSSPESAALESLARRTRAEDWGLRSAGDGVGTLEQEMLSGHVEGQFLKMLVHVTRAKRVLEVGMFTGYSALAMAEALPEDGQLIACEIDSEVAAFALECFLEAPGGSKIAVRVGPACDTLQELAVGGQTFDLIFIDADKAGYVDYLVKILDGGLLATHGLICADNTLMQGQPWAAGELTVNGTAIAEFNAAVAADPRVEQVLIPLRDGLTLIRRVDYI